MPAPAAPATADWSQLRDRNYKKQELYSMMWTDMELHKFRVACAPYGGPIAMVRDDGKLLVAQKQSTKPMIYVYTAAGKPLSQFQCDRGRIVGMGWSESEQLVTVADDGLVRIYGFRSEYKQFSLGKDAKDHGVNDVRIWGTGLVALTGNFQFIYSAFEEPRPTRLADMGLNEPPHSWIVLTPEPPHRQVEVLVATGTTITSVDASDHVNRNLTIGPVKRMALSSNQKLLALFLADGTVRVVSAIDLNRSLSNFATKSTTPPLQMVWCGSDCVVLHWDKIVLMVGPSGDWIKYSYDEEIYLMQEIDGTRVISNDKCEFIQRVPDDTESIFRIGSTTPAAALYDAYEHFERKSAKADELMRLIRPSLAEAVDACIEAAGHEFTPYYQQKLLKAASFGKSFLDIYDHDKFVDMCQTMRVLNAVRHYEIGIPLTLTQYRRLGIEGVIDRLIHRHQHLIALRIAEYLKLRTDKILVHWACERVKKQDQDDDEAVCQAIVEKLGGHPGISFAEVAETAYRMGKPELATRLLEQEPSAKHQVPLLIKINQDELALIKAMESGDTDLVYHVLLHIQRKLPSGEFFRIIHDKPQACNLFEVYCRQQVRPDALRTLKDYYDHDDRRLDSANIFVLEAYTATSLNERLRGLRNAQNLFNDDREGGFAARATEEQIKLLQFQEEVQKETGETYVDLSIAQTVYKLLIKGQSPRAEKLRSAFKMSDKQFTWLKVTAMGELGNWFELDRFSKTLKKSPIGFGPFVDVCIQHQAPREALKYIPRCNPEQRPAYFMRVAAWAEAAEAAFQLKDVATLQEIRQKCNNPKIASQVDQYVAQLVNKR